MRKHYPNEPTQPMLAKFLANTLYVQVRNNSFRVRHIESRTELDVSARRPFTTTRLLVGQFQEAESLLRQAIREVSGRGLFQVSPIVVIHPIEMIEGGLSEVEQRIFRELALGSGARNVVVHIGAPLTDSQVVAISQKKRGSV